MALSPRIERVDEALQRLLLRRAQLCGLRFARERVPFGGLRALAARLALHGRDERERASRCRAVVVREPERELDQRRRELLDDALDRRRLYPVRRRHADLRHDAAPARVAEAHLDDGAGADRVWHLVRELAREGARGHERIDGCVRDSASVVGAMVGG